MASLSTGFANGALIYSLGQVANFLFQLLLLKAFGPAHYGEIGLAHLLLLSVLFIGDLGYSSLFLREAPGDARWERRWRQALLHRLWLTGLLDGLVVLGWLLLYGHSGEGFGYLLGALPATLLGLANYSAPLLAQGRQRLGFLVQQVAWPAALLLWLLLGGLQQPASGLLAGLAASGGFLLQALVNVSLFGRLRLLLPRRCEQGRSMLRSALHVSLMGIAGTLHDRLTAFLLAQLAPAFLPVYLLLSQALSGASGVFNQCNRLLLVQAGNDTGRHWAAILASLLLLGMALGFQLLLGVAAIWGGPRERDWLLLAFPVLFAWSIATLGSLLNALLIGQGKERELAHVMLLGLVASSGLQFAGLALGNAEWLLWGRVLATLGMSVATLYLCRLAPTATGYCLGAAALAACFALQAPAAWWLSLSLLLGALFGARRQLLVLRSGAP